MKQFLVLTFLTLLTLSFATSKSSGYSACVQRQNCRAHFNARDYNLYTSCLKSCSKSVSSNDQAPSKIDHEKLWRQYHHEMTVALTRGAKRPYLQLTNVPIFAEWDKNVMDENSQFQILANTVPYWGNFYSPSQYKITNLYKSFLENVNSGTKIVDQQAKAELDKRANEIRDLRNRLYDAEDDCLFEKKNCDLKTKLEKEEKEKEAYLKYYTGQSYGWDNLALIESRMAVRSKLRFYESWGSLKEFVEQSKRGHGTKFTVHVNDYTAQVKHTPYDQRKSGLKNPKLNGNFFDIITKSKDNYGITTLSNKFKMTFKVENYARIQISPGEWFRTSVLQKYQNGPFITSQEKLFGDGGKMALLPTAIYVAYKPTTELIVNGKDAFAFEGAHEVKSSGMFHSSRTKATISTSRIDSDTYKVTIKSNSEVPQIIAFDFAELPSMKS